jgi:hypothetical protein
VRCRQSGKGRAFLCASSWANIPALVEQYTASVRSVAPLLLTPIRFAYFLSHSCKQTLTHSLTFIFSASHSFTFYFLFISLNMAEEIKQLQALLSEFDGDDTADHTRSATRDSGTNSSGSGSGSGSGTRAGSSSSTRGSGTSSSGTSSAMEEGRGHNYDHDHNHDHNDNHTVKLKYGSLIKTIEASSRSTTTATANSNSSSSTRSSAVGNTHETSPSFCRNCLRLMFTVFYLIYSKAWIIFNTVFIFTVIFICYSIK